MTLGQVTVKIGSRSFLVDRDLLTSRIPYFAKLFTDNPPELRKNNVVHLSIDVNCFGIILDYLKGNGLNLQMDNMEKLLTTVRFLGITRLYNACLAIFLKKCDSSNIVTFLKYAANADDGSYSLQLGLTHIQQNMKQLLDSPMLQKLSYPMVQEIVKGQNRIHGRSLITLALISKWAKSSPKRYKLFPRLFKMLDLSFNKPGLIEHFLASVDNSFSNASPVNRYMSYFINLGRLLFGNLDKLFVLARKLQANWRSFIPMDFGYLRMISICNLEHVLQNPAPVLIVNLYGCEFPFNFALVSSSGFVVTLTKSYELEGVKIKSRAVVLPMPIDHLRERPSGVCSLDAIYLIGGYVDCLAPYSISIYNLITRKWTNGPSLMVNRLRPAVVSLYGMIYVIGGQSLYSEEPLDSVEVYNPTNGAVLEIQPMLSKRSHHGAVVCDSKIYVIGGRDELSYTTSIECYDPMTRLWTEDAKLPEPIGHPTLIAHETCIYVFGCFSICHVKAFVFDTISKKWTNISSVVEEQFFIPF